jgi:amidohydrolase
MIPLETERSENLEKDAIKPEISAELEARRDDLCTLSLKIHDNPELGFHEFQASEWLTQFLKDNGFKIEKGISELPTAFRASYGQGRPVIAILAEYDALPELGHACGHNLIAGAAVGAGMAARQAADRFGGTLMVIGTPAEELYGGKAIMAEKGAFSDVDIAMMIHPGAHEAAVTEALACQGIQIDFFGKSAHAAARPESGINALEAMVQSFNALNSLRQHIRSKARVHGIITDGGKAANVVPEHSSGLFLVRAAEEAYLEELKKRVLNCFAGAATATGARLEYKWDEVYYAPMLNNLTLGKLFTRNMKSLGRKTRLYDPYKSFGSTDFGNVSQLVPGIHPSVSITGHGVVSHSSQFAEAAGSEKGLDGMMAAAKGMAMTAFDLLADPKQVEKAKDEFMKSK